MDCRCFSGNFGENWLRYNISTHCTVHPSWHYREAGTTMYIPAGTTGKLALHCTSHLAQQESWHYTVHPSWHYREAGVTLYIPAGTTGKVTLHCTPQLALQGRWHYTAHPSWHYREAGITLYIPAGTTGKLALHCTSQLTLQGSWHYTSTCCQPGSDGSPVALYWWGALPHLKGTSPIARTAGYHGNLALKISARRVWLQEGTQGFPDTRRCHLLTAVNNDQRQITCPMTSIFYHHNFSELLKYYSHSGSWGSF